MTFLIGLFCAVTFWLDIPLSAEFLIEEPDFEILTAATGAAGCLGLRGTSFLLLKDLGIELGRARGLLLWLRSACKRHCCCNSTFVPIAELSTTRPSRCHPLFRVCLPLLRSVASFLHGLMAFLQSCIYNPATLKLTDRLSCCTVNRSFVENCTYVWNEFVLIHLCMSY